MDTYMVVTSSTCISSYTVDAKSKEEAKSKLYSGEWDNCEHMDFKDEVVEEVMQVGANT